VAEAVRAFYAAEIRYQDRQLGRLLTVLDRHLDLDRTLLLITADHGENLGEGGRWDHVFALNDALVHVPMILRMPGRLPAGVRESGLCSLLDVPATVADVVGGLDLAPGPGRSLLPGTFRPRDVVFAQGDPYLGHLERMGFVTGFERDVAGFADLLLSARDGRFKYVLSSRDGGRLYDLDRDPAETRDVSDAHPARAAALAAALDAWRDRTPRYAPGTRDARALDAREREQLESLGYVQ
jgi:arylsulfatase A-like enzyme